MTNIYTAAILFFFLPLMSALVAIFMPEEIDWFTKLIIGLYIFLVILYIVMLVGYKKKKRQNAARIISALNMILFSLLFTFPLIKILTDHLPLSIILALFFFICIWLAIVDQNRKTPLVFPNNRENHGILNYIFYAIPVVVIFVGGGGNIILVRQMHLTFGDSLMSVYGSVLLYILGCWLGFFMASLYYKGLVKEGRLVK